jgi:hypothetical protein
MAWALSLYREEQEKEEAERLKKETAEQLALAELHNKDHIEVLDSPYDTIFGPGVYDYHSYNSIMVTTGSYPAMVCLQEVDPPNRTIRNDYADAHMTFGWKQIPDGKYVVKVYRGKNWSVNKPMAGGHARGGFTKDELFFGSMRVINLYKATTPGGAEHQEDKVWISDTANDEYHIIRAEDFFR